MKSIEFKNLTKLEYTRNEQLNSLGVNLKFSGKKNKVIGITSCNENAGKTFISMNLSRKYAEDGQKVLLIDADLRKSRIVRDYNVQGVDEIKGLSHYLSGQAEMDDVIYSTNVPNMHIVFAGHSVPNPVMLLDTERFDKLLAAAREKYDAVIVDTPPVLPVIDTAVIVPKCDGSLIVVHFGNTRKQELIEAKKQLEMANTRILGAILNQVPVNSNRYSYYHYRKYFKYSYNRYYKRNYGYGKQYGYGKAYGSKTGEYK